MAKEKQAAGQKKKSEVAALVINRMAPKDAKRKGKAVARMSIAKVAVEKKPLEIAKGKGKKLGDIPYVCDMLTKKASKDEALTHLHRIALGAPSKALFVKRHLREFSGVVFTKDFSRDVLRARVDRRTVNVLRGICTVCGLERGGSRDEIVDRIVAWLEKPCETDAKAPKATKKRAAPTKKASKGKKTTKKVAEKKAGSRKKPAAKKAKKAAKEGPKRPLSAYMFFVKEKRDEVAKKHPKEKVTEIAKRMGEAWRALKEKDKSPFDEKAKKDKARYEREKAKAK